MAGFKSVHDYQEFENVVRRQRRFFQPANVQEFLEAVLATSRQREVTIEAGKTLWRAQIGSREWSRSDGDGNNWVEDVPYPPERMVPPPSNPSEGRINPRGIAYLYLATDGRTALSEVRPWVHARVSLAAFEMTKNLRLADCSKSHGKPGGWAYLLGIPREQWATLSQEQIDQAVWADIDDAFSRPIQPLDEHFNYVPTQILAEHFLANGFDGIVYRSGLSKKGFNVALFDVNAAILRTCQLFQVEQVAYDFKEDGNAWFLQDGKYFTNVITDIRPIPDGDRSEGAGDKNAN